MSKQRKRSVHGTGSVFLRKDGRWEAKFKVEETGKYKSLYAPSEKEVYKKLEDALYEQKQGILATGSQQTVKQFIEYWLEEVHKSKIRIGTYLGYRIILDVFLIPGLGHVKLQKLTAQQIQAFYGKLSKKGIASSRIKNINMVLHVALKHAKRIRLVSINVSEDVELPSVKEREIEPLTEEQAKLLLQKVREHHLEALLTLALTTGMRKGEILALHWQDINFEQGTLYIRSSLGYYKKVGFVEGEPKTEGSKRQITLPQVTIEALKRHRVLQLEAQQQKDEGWNDKKLVFPGKKGSFMVPQTLTNHFNRLLKEVGIPRVRFHDLRHSAGTLLLLMGVPERVVQKILGHSNIATTMRYLHVLPPMQQSAMDKMDDMFGHQS